MTGNPVTNFQLDSVTVSSVRISYKTGLSWYGKPVVVVCGEMSVVLRQERMLSLKVHFNENLKFIGTL